MSDAILITCPDCGKQMKVPPTLAGKKIRCKGCQAAVPVPATKKPVDTRVTTPEARSQRDDEDDEFKIDHNPYGVQEMNLAPHCPHCANELDPPDSTVCLHCGFHMVKRQREAQQFVYERTATDFILWHLPTLGAVLGMAAVIGGIAYYHWWLPDVVLNATDAKAIHEDRWTYMDNEQANWMGIMFHWGIEIWGIVFGLFALYKLGWFAVKRIVFNFLPPERKKVVEMSAK